MLLKQKPMDKKIILLKKWMSKDLWARKHDRECSSRVNMLLLRHHHNRRFHPPRHPLYLHHRGVSPLGPIPQSKLSHLQRYRLSNSSSNSSSLAS